MTVKRVTDGLVSNWMNDNLVAGDNIESPLRAACSASPGTEPVLAFGAGSGITPIISS